MTGIPSARICIPEDDRREILAAIDEALRTGALTLGPNGRAFETAFAAVAGTRFAAAVASGTAALEIVLRALGAGGREVVVPTNTFFATAAAVVRAGARPRFVDVDPRTMALDLAHVEAAVTAETAGVIAVDIAGAVSPELSRIEAFCRARGLFLLEDAAHAAGASLGDRPAGSFGDAGAFSFYPTKVITAGEGGMIVTDDPVLHEEALRYRDQGKEDFLTNLHVRMGANWRLGELHAIVGLVQLRRLEAFVAERRRVAAEYTRRLAGVPGLMPLLPLPGSASNFYKYVALLDARADRRRIKRALKERFDVALSGEVYELPCHHQPVFKEWADGHFPVADDLCARHVCLPIFPGMTVEQIERVVGALATVLAAGASR